MVYIEKREIYYYPNKNENYSSSKRYPEYPFKHLSKEKNHIYDMVREVLHGLGYDDKKYNTKYWNPLGHIIKPGDFVLIKPNMVLDSHELGTEYSIDCLITHPSLVRAILDYVYIALNGEGKIIIADAPLQSCDFKRLCDVAGYNEIVEFYRKNTDIKIELIDLRKIESRISSDLYITVYECDGDPRGYTKVDISNYSEHKEKRKLYKKFRVTNYNVLNMRKFHNENKNTYLISNTVLQADVIINMPKPKTHRKAGITAALKNFIGIIGHKECLPHHTKGSIIEGGDEYPVKDWRQRWAVHFQEIRNYISIHNYKILFPMFKKLTKFFWKLAYIKGKNKFSEGSWYGNDTIWRTTHDLNRIVFYADKNGNIKETVQRKYFAVGDMIISGEKEGPLMPTPKDVGIILASEDPVAFDYAVCRIMGFDYKKIPTVFKAFISNTLPLTTKKPEDIIILSNVSKADYKKNKFIPTLGWQGHIESED